MEAMNQLIQYSNEPATISRLSDNHFIEVNEPFLKTTGYRREEVLGRTALELGLWERPEVYEEIGRQLTTVGMVRQLPISFRMKSGETRQCLFSAVVGDIDGEKSCISLAKILRIRRGADSSRALKRGRESYDGITAKHIRRSRASFARFGSSSRLVERMKLSQGIFP
jgi:PAS domain S-box-containing protein